LHLNDHTALCRSKEIAAEARRSAAAP
jgi:hypothetical protein